MRIRVISLLLALLLVMSALFGCARPGEPQDPDKPPVVDPSDPQSGKKQEKPPVWQDTGSGISYDLSALEYVSEGVYRLPDDFRSGNDFFYSLDLCPTTLLVNNSFYGGEDDYKQELSCFDVKTGKRLGYKEDPDHNYEMLDCGLIAMVDYHRQSASLLRSDFSEELKLEPENPTGCEFSICRFSQDGRYLAVAFSGQQSVTIYTLDGSQEPRQIELPDEPFYGYSYQNLFYIECMATVVLLDPVDGKIQVREEDGLGRNGLARLSGCLTYLLQDPETKLLLSGPGEYGAYDYGFGNLLLCDWTSDDVYCLLKIAEGTRINPNIGGEKMEAGAVCDGLAAFHCGDSIYLMDLARVPGEPSGAQVITAKQLDNTICELTADFFRRYGIKLFYGSEGNDFDVYDYAGQVEKDAGQIYSAATLLRDTLAYFPEETLREICQEVNGLSIYFCGRLAAVGGAGGISNALAVTFKENGHRAMAIGAHTLRDFSSTVFHELMHVMDDLLQSKEDETDIPYLSGWEELLPEGACYEFSYHSDGGNRYTAIEGDPLRRWFVDSYAKSYPTEDRARIMEYLIQASTSTDQEDDQYSQYFDGTPLAQKAALLCRLLRECIPSLKDAPVQIWERPVQEVEIPAEWLELFHLT